MIGPGTRIGPYEIISILGEGGMGTVWRGHHSGLGRDDALKVLSEPVSADPDGVARFEREARVLASLNHPNITPVHALEHHGDRLVLVMELVAGRSLASIVAAGPIPWRRALDIMRQVALALEAAHAKSIVHRDLKPDNVMLTDSGAVKVLDFGLAKTVPALAGVGDAIETAAPGPSAPGMLIGTPSYMSPEQLRGEDAGRQSDIWAFGCMLFELLTGTRAFGRASGPEVLAAILEREPEWSTLPPALPPAITRLLRRCLEKDVSRRLRDVGDARIEIEDALHDTTAAPTGTTVSGQRAWSPRAVGAVVAATVAILAIGMAAWRSRSTETPAETRLDIATPPTDNPGSFALSPDGRRLAFVARDGNASKLWLRSLNESSAVPVAGTEGANYSPFWSPDGRALVFFSGNVAKRLDLESGAIRDVLTGARYGTWGPDDTLLFGFPLGPLQRVRADGSGAAPATSLVEQQTQHWHPAFMPDGHHFVYYASAGSIRPGLFVGDLSSPTGVVRLLSDIKGGSPAAVLAGRWLLFMRGTSLLAQRFDASTARMSGEPVRVADQMGDTFESPALSVSATGVIAYRINTGIVISQLTWFDRTGRETGVLGEARRANGPELSPDGTRALQDGSLLDGTRVVARTSLSSGKPIWSPDGQRFVVGLIIGGRIQLYASSIDDTIAENATPLLTTDQNKGPTDWSPDGRFVLYNSLDPRDGMDMWILPMDGNAVPVAWLKTRFVERNGQFSPDGRFIAYQSDKSGRSEVYVRPFRGAESAAGPEWPVSTAGGVAPRWSADGTELFYIDPLGALMAAGVSVTAPELRINKPQPLFTTRIKGGAASTSDTQYDVAPDGRFLINTISSETSPITIIQNWRPPQVR